MSCLASANYLLTCDTNEHSINHNIKSDEKRFITTIVAGLDNSFSLINMVEHLKS